MDNTRVFRMPFASVYPHYIAKAGRIALEQRCTPSPLAVAAASRMLYLRSTSQDPMSTESLKLQLIERLLRTEDEDLLKRMADLFRSEKVVKDEDGLTDEHYNIVKERYAEYKRGEGKSYTWEETKAMIRAGKGKEA